MTGWRNFFHRGYFALALALALLGAYLARAPESLSSGWWSALHRMDPHASEADRPTHVVSKLPDGQQRAFPTAEGFGAAAKGGRGGRVIFVTTIAEAGDGSLRACIEANGPRTCVFRLGGTITLERNSLEVRNPYLTIAGETAPGGGIAIRNGARQDRPSLEVLTHDVIVRHIRIRPGPHEVESCCSGAIGLYSKAARNIIFDHVSASWGSDETIDSEEASFVTFQWCFVTEPLLDGGPGKHNRARNMLLSEGGNFSIHHNLFALGKFRNPQIAPSIDNSTISVVNNVLYSPVWEYVVSFSDRWSAVRANIVGNYKIKGRAEELADARLVHLFSDGEHGFSVFSAANWDEAIRPDGEMADEKAVAEEMRDFIVSSPAPAPDITATSALEAYEDVLAFAGATRPARDAVDKRIADAVRTRSGELLRHDPLQVGGWPTLSSPAPPADQDHDGMADGWERERGYDPSDPDDGIADVDGDGWTNFEEYLHELAGDVSSKGI